MIIVIREISGFFVAENLDAVSFQLIIHPINVKNSYLILILTIHQLGMVKCFVIGLEQSLDAGEVSLCALQSYPAEGVTIAGYFPRLKGD